MESVEKEKAITMVRTWCDNEMDSFIPPYDRNIPQSITARGMYITYESMDTQNLCKFRYCNY